jgi:hypothetical protein
MNNWKAVKKRLTNPLFLAAIASILYQALQKNGQAPDFGTYQLYIDLVCYALGLGGIYSTFDSKTKK